MAQRFAIDAIFRAIDQITSPVTRMARNVGKAADRMERKLGKVNGALDKIGSGAAGMGKAVAVGAAVAAAAITHVADVGAGFEQTLISAGAKFGGIKRGTAAFEDLNEAALAVSSTTEFAGSEAGGALKFLATAGEEVATSMGALGNFADFATANEAELARATDISSDSIAVLGLNLDKLGNKITDPTKKIAAYARTNDLLTTTAAGANLTLEQVFETVKKGGAIARSAGQSVETFLAATQTVSGSIKGAEAGTALKTVMNNILKSSGKASKAMKKLRISAIDKKTGAIRELPDILDDIKAKLGKFKEGKRKRILADLFGLAEATGTSLINNVDELRTRIGVMVDRSKGKVTELSTTMRDSALNSFKTLGSTIEAIEIGIFNIIRDDIVKIVDATTEWAKANKAAFGKAVMKSLEFMRDNFDAIVEKGPRVLALVGSLMALAKVLAVVQSVLAVVAALTAATAGTLGLIVIAVLALIVVLILVVFYWDRISRGLDIISNKISDTLIVAVDWLVAVWDKMIAGVKEGDALWTVLAVTLAALSAPLLLVLSPIIALVALGKLLIDNWSDVGFFFKGLWIGIKDVFWSQISFIIDTLDSLKEGFNDLLGLESEVKVKGSVDLPEGFDTPQPAFAGAPGEFGFGGTAANDGGSRPQVINTSNEQLQRTIEESTKRVEVAVNVNAPPGVVNSVEQRGDDESLTMTASGDL